MKPMKAKNVAPKKGKKGLGVRKKVCRFCTQKIKTIDYKDTKTLEVFLSERGKIISSRISGNCAKHQRRLSKEIKRARFLSLLPYVRY
ncbi:MAG: 30S ribosomal protein S18 [Candidatus Omnitrophica bacterium]|nr:30S ribosomal protein S18 [Candidatus Omnitrophota bacterium]